MDMNEASILIVDDNPGVLSAGKRFLKRHFAEVDTGLSAALLKEMHRYPWQVPTARAAPLSRWKTTARAYRPNCSTKSSSPFSPPKPRATVWV